MFSDSFIENLKFYKTILNYDVVYDIGANEGNLYYEFKNKINMDSTIYLFEGNVDMQDKLQQTGGKFFIALLGEEDNKEVKFYKNPQYSTGASIYVENSNIYDNCIVETRNIETLSSLIERNNLKAPTFIKMDVQGYELNVLKGIKKEHLDKCDAILLEVANFQYNKDAPLVTEVYNYMKSIGYRPFDTVDVSKMHLTNSITGQKKSIIFQQDVLFVKTTHQLFSLENKFVLK